MSKILIEITPISESNLTGIGKYVWNMISRFPQSDEIKYVSFKDIKIKRLASNLSNLKIVRFPLKGKRTIFNIFGKNLVVDNDSKLYWSNYFIFPLHLEKKLKILSTVHDLSPFDDSYYNIKYNKFVFRLLMKRTIIRSTKIITISQYVANELIKRFDIPTEKIEVIYPASSFTDMNFKDMKDKEELIRKKYNLKESFILSVCSLTPRKNLKTVIKAFSKLKNKKTSLVLAGKILMNNETVIESKKALGERIKYLGYVPDEDLPALYAAANVFVAPSLEEGFDIPPVEALSLGTRVLASDIPVHREVLENDVEYFDPENDEELANLMEKSLMSFKETICSKVPSKFSWDKSSKKIFNLLNMMAND